MAILRYHINAFTTYNYFHANILYLDKFKTVDKMRKKKDVETWSKGYNFFFMFNSHYMQLVLVIKFKFSRIVHILKPILRT